MLGWSVPGPVFQSLNAGYIILFAPILAWLWIWLSKRNLNPSAPVKFAFGVAMAGLGFLALVAGMKASGPTGLTPVLFIFLIYWIHTMGELMLSPVGLSAVDVVTCWPFSCYQACARARSRYDNGRMVPLFRPVQLLSWCDCSNYRRRNNRGSNDQCRCC